MYVQLIELKNPNYFWRAFGMLFGCLLVVSCGQGGGTSSPSASKSAPIVVLISPTSATVTTGTGQQSFVATVSNSAAVSWSVGGVNGGNLTVGTITSAGVYTAPSTSPTPAKVTVTANSQLDTTKFASATVTLVAPAPSDTQAPTVPANLVQTSISVSSVGLTWMASIDLPNSGGSGIGGYRVYRNGIKIATVSGTSFTDTGLTGGTAYSYAVSAFDNAVPINESLISSPSLLVTTTADQQPPTIPTGLSASNLTSNTVVLTWGTATDLPTPGGTGVGGYFITRNGVQIAATTSASYFDADLVPTSQYSYQVAAFDKSTPPNISTLSSAIQVTTPSQQLLITPRNAALTQSQTQQFATTAPIGTSINWSVDGIAGGNIAVGSITSAGFYTAAKVPGSHNVAATNPLNPLYTGSTTVAVTDLAGIMTYHVDVARTGQNLQEYLLTPATVAGGNFGKQWSCPVDGAVYAQPLYVANLSIGGGNHNVVIIATMHDSVYAFDADNPTCHIYWTVPFINPEAGITTLASADILCADVMVEYGITGTPVIDPNTRTLYLVAKTKENGSYFQRLHALDLSTGAERVNSPKAITAMVVGNGYGNVAGTITFDPLYQNQRPGLVLSNGNIYIAWGSHCDYGNYHGWVISYDKTTLNQVAAFNATPNGSQGGIWMSGGAPAVDSIGNIFLSTGNGVFDNLSNMLPALALNNDFGESFVNLNPSTLTVQDFYTPSQNMVWSQNDLDISSGGITVLPDGTGPAGHPNVLIGFDKLAHLWMIDRSNMSRFSPTDNTVQYLNLPAAVTCVSHCLSMTAAFWNGTIYASQIGTNLVALPLSAGLVASVPAVAPAQPIAAPSSQSTEVYGYPGVSPMISATPTGSAILWTLDNGANANSLQGPAVLRAYNANNLGTTLYSSSSLLQDAGGGAVKFTVPVIANGHVYIGGESQLTVYGMSP